MPIKFHPYEPDQFLLLTPDICEWLPEGYLAGHVGDLMDRPEKRAGEVR